MSKSGNFSTNTAEGKNLKFSWDIDSQSISKNETVISWRVTVGGSSSGWVYARKFKVVVAGSTVFSSDSDKQLNYGDVIASGKKTISHNADGSANFTASVQAAIYGFTVNSRGSGSWDIDKIPRGVKITSAPNFNDEQNPTIKFSAPAGKYADQVQARISIPGVKVVADYRKIEVVDKTSYKFILTDDERNLLRGALFDKSSSPVEFKIWTKISGNDLYSTVRKTVTIVNADPLIKNFTAAVSDERSLELTGSNSVAIKECSNVKVKYTPEAQKKASITSNRIGMTGGKSYSNTELTFSKVNSNQFYASLEDSRGNLAKKTITLDMVDYFHPTCDVDVSLTLAEDNTVTASLSIGGRYFDGSFGAVSNTRTLEYRYKSTGDWSEWIAIDSTYSKGKYTASVDVLGLPYKDSYIFETRVTDALRSATAQSKSIRLLPVFDWSEDDFNFNVPVNMSSPLPVTSGGTGAKNPRERREMTYNTTNFQSHNARCEKVDFLGMTFIRIYVKTSGEFAAGKSYPIGKVPSDVTPMGKHALSVRSTRSITASIDDTGEIEMLVGTKFSGSYDVYITGFWFNR